MKLIVQIPCLNEAGTLPAVLAAIPRQIPGVERVEVLVIDDGSQDGTAEVAKQHGADHVLRLDPHQGLGGAFAAGLDMALRLGADLVVNTDGDGQYEGAEIPALLAPILAGQAELVLGDRGPGTLAHFSPVKRLLQRWGNSLVRRLTGLRLNDATSGFRAMTRRCAARMQVHAQFTYTLETLIQVGSLGLVVLAVPIQARPPTRPSRLFRSLPEYLARAGLTALRGFAMYRPLSFFGAWAGLALLPGLLLGLRGVYAHLQGYNGHVQSLLLATLLISLAVLLAIAGVLADLSAANRRLLEELRAARRESDRSLQR